MPKLKEIDLDVAKVKEQLPTKENYPELDEETIEYHRERMKQQLISQLGAQTFNKIIDIDNPVQVEVNGQEIEEENENKYQVEVKAWEVIETD